jgi:Uri superfamily endonuclease
MMPRCGGHWRWWRTIINVEEQRCEEKPFKTFPEVIIVGDESVGGSYILRLQVERPLKIHFGRFQRAKPVLVPQGEMLYLGSAMRGLASRVLRHALRTGNKPTHALYEPLLLNMQKAGLANGHFHQPSKKKLHWHIDYLLDETAVRLKQALLIRSEKRVEGQLGEWLLAQPETFVLVPGLGASDVKGHTHLLGIR